MASRGIRDKVAIIGMGCTPFGEHWAKGPDDLLVDATTEALDSAGIAIEDVDAFWLGTMGSGGGGTTLSKPLKIDHKPVTRVENFCATGSESFRNAAYAVASGAYDVVVATGVEKLKDSGFSGLTAASWYDPSSARRRRRYGDGNVMISAATMATADRASSAHTIGRLLNPACSSRRWIAARPAERPAITAV